MTEPVPFVEQCRRDRAEYARYLAQCEDGCFTLKRQAIGGGPMRDVTEDHKTHIRKVIADLDDLVSDLEADDA
jgi:hypothetical protein